MKTIHLFLFLMLYSSGLSGQLRYHIVIDEIMADPSPSAGLPANEWIELRNISLNPVNLLDWRVGDASGLSGTFPGFFLQPDSTVIICSSSALNNMEQYGPAISVSSFPSLDNDGDLIYIQDADGMIIHAVGYNSSWYQNELKKDGGWSLEMIDSNMPCYGSNNWRASIAAIGGTPGKINAIDGNNPDLAGPFLKNSYTNDSLTIVLVFNEPLDSINAANLGNYSIDRGLSFTHASAIAPLFNAVELKTDLPLKDEFVYTITAQNLKDCQANPIGIPNSIKTGLPVDPDPGELIVNEILFNPRPNGFDYVEFYNRSHKIFDASKLFIANRNSAGAISSIEILSTIPFYVFPGEYIVVTQEAENLTRQYLVKNENQVLALNDPPSFPDDQGDVILLNFQGTIVDEVSYDKDWHFKLVDNPEGIALERIDPAGSSINRSNWHSAASSAGYGTPTYKNSQFLEPVGIPATIEINPKVFSPDNDGLNDIATILYKSSELGYVANISIFDAAGRIIKNLVRNAIMGLQGYWNWDGLDDKGLKLPIGTYIILTEIFNLQGKKKVFKNVVVLARALK